MGLGQAGRRDLPVAGLTPRGVRVLWGLSRHTLPLRAARSSPPPCRGSATGHRGPAPPCVYQAELSVSCPRSPARPEVQRPSHQVCRGGRAGWSLRSASRTLASMGLCGRASFLTGRLRDPILSPVPVSVPIAAPVGSSSDKAHGPAQKALGGASAHPLGCLQKCCFGQDGLGRGPRGSQSPESVPPSLWVGVAVAYVTNIEVPITHITGQMPGICMSVVPRQETTGREESDLVLGQVRLQETHTLDRASARGALPEEERQASLRGRVGPSGLQAPGASTGRRSGAPWCLVKPGLWNSARLVSPGTWPGPRGLTCALTVGKGQAPA